MDEGKRVPAQRVVWGAPARPRLRAGARGVEQVSAIVPKIKKKSAKDAAGCKEGCCSEDAGARGKSQQGKSYLRRYGLLRQQDATNSAATRSKSKAVAVDDGVEMTAKGASLLFDQRRLKGKERDLEAGDGESGQTSDSMLEWGVDVSSKVIGGESIMNAAAEVAVECCRLCLEADECCRQLCCAALCCLQELGASLATGNTYGSLGNKPPSTNPLTTVHLDLSGLDCADCSLTVERTLKRNSAVVAVVVSAMTNKAEVTFDSMRTNEATIMKDIRALGFGAELAAPASATRLLLRVAPVPGAGDGDLSAALAQLKSEPGIVSAVCKRKKKLIIIDYHPAQAKIRTAIEALEESGLSVTVVRDEPGKTRAQKQVRSWQWRFWASAVLSVPVFFISFLFPHLPEVDDAFDEELTQGLSVGVFLCWLLATPIQFVMAWPLYGSSYRALRYGHKANMDTLVILSTLTAYTYSVVAVIVAMAGTGFEGDSFFETSAILLTLIMLGRYLEALARGKACNVVSSLRNEQATTALLLGVGKSDCSDTMSEQSMQEREMDVELIQPGDLIKVLPGAKVAVDGVVIYGASSVDESLVTGESMPVAKSIGSPVLGGTINQHGTIQIRATKSASESTLAAISRLVEDAQAGKPRLQRLADVIASYFVPAILLLALAVLALWLCLSALDVVDTDGDHWVPFSLQFAFAVLVVSCPCAIGLAVPLAVMVASGVGAKHGVIIKSGATIEACRRINTVVFDKTGTLTRGQLSVVDHWWLDHTTARGQQDGTDEPHQQRLLLLSLIGSAEQGSEHVLAKAVVRFIESQPDVPELTEPSDFSAVPGRGLSAHVREHAVLVGNRAWMLDNGVDGLGDAEEETAVAAAAHESEGRTVVWAAVDGRAACALALEDSLRPEARQVVQHLQSKGVEVWVLSGDQQRTVHAVARQLGIAEANAIGGLVPEDKVDKIRSLQLNATIANNDVCGYNVDKLNKYDDDNDNDKKSQKKRAVVAMVGDGVNDAPSLAQADVGVAVGGGTDIAIAAGDVVLMRNDLRDVLLMIHLARRTHAVIMLNFVWAFVYNAVAIPLAAGVLYPGTQFVIPPAAAGLSEILSSLPIIFFSLLLRLYRPPSQRQPSSA